MVRLWWPFIFSLQAKAIPGWFQLVLQHCFFELVATKQSSAARKTRDISALCAKHEAETLYTINLFPSTCHVPGDLLWSMCLLTADLETPNFLLPRPSLNLSRTIDECRLSWNNKGGRSKTVEVKCVCDCWHAQSTSYILAQISMETVYLTTSRDVHHGKMSSFFLKSGHFPWHGRSTQIQINLHIDARGVMQIV